MQLPEAESQTWPWAAQSLQSSPPMPQSSSLAGSTQAPLELRQVVQQTPPVAHSPPLQGTLSPADTN